jgi:hypothetical protein
VNRFAIATAVVAFATVARADTPKPAVEVAAKPDPIADVEGREANLEPQEPRKGLTFAGSVGGSITIGDGVGRGPALSLRLGHVATRKTIITFELSGTSALHQTTTQTKSDSNFGLFVGAQRYTSGSFWLRTAGGPTVLVKNLETDGTGGDPPIGGLGGLVGGGLDLARWGSGSKASAWRRSRATACAPSSHSAWV